MSNRYLVVLVGITALLIAAVAVGCGGGEDTSEAPTTAESKPAPASTSPGDSEADAYTPEQAGVVALGEPITLKVIKAGEAVQVSATELYDPITAGTFKEPAAGNKYVGVRLTIKNVGKVPYNDSPSNGTTLTDATGKQLEQAILVGGNCAEVGDELKLAPGETGKSCVPFEISKTARIERISFTPGSQFGDQTGSWEVTR